MLNNKERDLQENLKEDFMNYDSGYICDVISEICDNNIDIYNKDLLDDAWELYANDWYKQAIEEFGSSGDLIKDLQMAQYCRNNAIFYKDLDDLLEDYIINKTEKLLENEDLQEETKDDCIEYVSTYHDLIDNNSLLEDVIDNIETLIQEFKDNQSK